MKFKHPKNPLKQRINISFSGGKTSAMMTKLLLDNLNHDEYDFLITFANTSLEHDKTLEFVDRCDKELFGGRVVWLEAVVHHNERKSCSHRVVNFETAKRDGSVMEDVNVKYGISCQTGSICNRETKINTIKSCLRQNGWSPNTYSTAIGIRSDEIDRVSLPSMKRGVFYPCVDNNITKEDVRVFWEDQSFNLEIPEHYGNCVTCFKKSRRKLLTIAQDDPRWFKWNQINEEKYEFTGAEYRRENPWDKPRRFFRGNLSTKELLDMASKGDFEPFVDGHVIDFDPEMDIGGGCGASCEIGADGAEWDDTDNDTIDVLGDLY